MKPNYRPKLTPKHQTQLRDDIVIFLLNKTWPSVVENYLGSLEPGIWYYRRWYPQSLAAMIKGDYGVVFEGTEPSPIFTGSELDCAGNYPVTLWNSEGTEPDETYFIDEEDPIADLMFVKDDDITEEEVELRAKGWESIRPIFHTNPEPTKIVKLRNKFTQIVDERLDLLLNPVEASNSLVASNLGGDTRSDVATRGLTTLSGRVSPPTATPKSLEPVGK